MRKALLPALLALVATPAFAQDERQWYLASSDVFVALSWAIPESDDGGPSFSCSPGEGMIKVVQLVEHRVAREQPTADGRWLDAKGRPAPWSGELRLTSGKVSETLTAVVQPEEMYGGSIMEAEVSPETPLMKAFGRTGVITLTSFGETEAPPPAPVDEVRKLLAACMPGS